MTGMTGTTGTTGTIGAARTEQGMTPAPMAARKRARPRGRFTVVDGVWLALAALYFLVPLIGSAEFSLETGPHRYGFDAYDATLRDPNFQSSFLLSFELAVSTVLLSIVLMVPTVFWVNLRLPRLRPVLDFIGVLPFVVPPVTLAIAILRMFRSVPWLISGPQILVLVYVILALPFTYRSLDAGIQAIALRTLTEAGQSLGASWATILLRIVLPNLRFAILSAAFLTVTLVMGEYTMASLLLFNTFATYMFQIGSDQANQAAALAILSLLLTWAAMFGILFLGRGTGGRGGRQAQIGGAR